jgi:two-component system, sensor histidine kinase and response regulator
MSEILKDVQELNKTKRELVKKIKQLEKERERFLELNNDLNNFVHSISHDLKSPISHLKGLIDILFLTVGKNEAELKSLILDSLNNLQTRVEDLSILETVTGKEGHSTLDFHNVMKEVRFDLQDQIKQSNAMIIEDFTQCPTIYFSKKNLRSILYNLVGNAIKYASPGVPPCVTVVTEKARKKNIVLKVSDNGMGITDADLDKIFFMYKRLTNHVEGKGVGLALVKRIVENAEGKIEVKSELGVGTTFKVYLKE